MISLTNLLNSICTEARDGGPMDETPNAQERAAARQREQADPTAVVYDEIEHPRTGEPLFVPRYRTEAAQQTSEVEALRAALEGGVALIAAERQRQREKGYDAAHDASVEDAGQLADAAYMVLFEHTQGPGCVDDEDEPEGWEQALALKMRTANPIRRLTVAAALIAAEIDRLAALARTEGR